MINYLVRKTQGNKLAILHWSVVSCDAAMQDMTKFLYQLLLATYT